tara:strand:+ start:146 stop:418 length:273 start_codon:yes stop_codon:yes gene_type:complete
MSNKQAQNEYLASLWREHRKTVELPKTSDEAMQLSYEAKTMLHWFYDNSDDIGMTTYAGGLRLARLDVGSYEDEARYLAKRERLHNETQH